MYSSFFVCNFYNNLTVLYIVYIKVFRMYISTSVYKQNTIILKFRKHEQPNKSTYLFTLLSKVELVKIAPPFQFSPIQL